MPTPSHGLYRFGGLRHVQSNRKMWSLRRSGAGSGSVDGNLPTNATVCCVRGNSSDASASYNSDAAAAGRKAEPWPLYRSLSVVAAVKHIALSLVIGTIVLAALDNDLWMLCALCAACATAYLTEGWSDDE